MRIARLRGLPMSARWVLRYNTQASRRKRFFFSRRRDMPGNANF